MSINRYLCLTHFLSTVLPLGNSGLASVFNFSHAKFQTYWDSAAGRLKGIRDFLIVWFWRMEATGFHEVTCWTLVSLKIHVFACGHNALSDVYGSVSPLVLIKPEPNQRGLLGMCSHDNFFKCFCVLKFYSPMQIVYFPFGKKILLHIKTVMTVKCSVEVENVGVPLVWVFLIFLPWQLLASWGVTIFPFTFIQLCCFNSSQKTFGILWTVTLWPVIINLTSFNLDKKDEKELNTDFMNQNYLLTYIFKEENYYDRLIAI